MSTRSHKVVSLSDEERIALEAICRHRKVDALVWKRARAFLLLDAGEDAGTVCRILDIGPTVLTEWRLAFGGAGLSFLGLKDYSQRQGHLSVAQEQALKCSASYVERPAWQVLFQLICSWEWCGHMYGLSVRLIAAGLDEVRDTRG